MTGRYDEALAVIRESPDPRGGNDLLLALAGAGRGREALAVADSLLAANDTVFAWDSVIATLGHQDPRIASALVRTLESDRDSRRTSGPSGCTRTRVRIAAVDSEASLARLRDAAAVEGQTDGAARARIELLRRSLVGRARSTISTPPPILSPRW